LSARRLQAYGWLLLNTLAFGATVPIVKWGLPYTTPFRFLLYRFAIGSLIAIPVLVYHRKALLKHLPHIFESVGVEIIGTTLALAALYIGLAHTTSLEANLIITTGPVFIAIGGYLFLREKVRTNEWLGLGVATAASIFLVLIPSLAMGTAWSTGNLFGNSLVMLQNILNVAYFLLAKRIYHKIPKLITTCMSVMVGFVSFALLSLIEVGGSQNLLHLAVTQDLSHPPVWVIAAFAAIITSFVGLTTYMKGQDLIGVSEASIFNYLQPIVFVPLSFLLLGEKIVPLQILSFVFVILGVWWAEKVPSKNY